MTLMSLGGFALTSDHSHLVYQRDILKAATDAASIATTRHWQQELNHLTDDGQIKAGLRPIAERYILANIPEDRRADAAATLNFELRLHHNIGMVDVDADADLGGVIFARWMIDDATADALQITRVESRTERIEEGGLTEVALALDITNSMLYTPAGVWSPRGSDNRIETVKRAALDLVNTLTADGNGQTAVGLVPWNYLVRLNAGTRTRWEQQGWVSYPTQRTYPNPYTGATTGETHTLPGRNGASWWGCVDQRSLCTAGTPTNPWVGCLSQHEAADTSPPGLSLALPSNNKPSTKFTMLFYPARNATPNRYNRSISYQCRADKPQKSCYDESSVPHGDRPDQRNLQSGEYYLEDPQLGCWNRGGREILPLTTDTDRIKGAIQALSSWGSATYSTPGIVWAHRLLSHEWRSAWGDNRTHPVNPDDHADVQKALVLLTDGEDNHLSNLSATEAHRQYACQAAKDDGITVFTIAAMKTDGGPSFTALKRALTQCASKPEYAFINNATSDALENTFRQVAQQLRRFRRVY